MIQCKRLPTNNFCQSQKIFWKIVQLIFTCTPPISHFRKSVFCIFMAWLMAFQITSIYCRNSINPVIVLIGLFQICKYKNLHGAKIDLLEGTSDYLTVET